MDIEHFDAQSDNKLDNQNNHSKDLPDVQLDQVSWSIFTCAAGLFGVQLEHVPVDGENIRPLFRTSLAEEGEGSVADRCHLGRLLVGCSGARRKSVYVLSAWESGKRTDELMNRR